MLTWCVEVYLGNAHDGIAHGGRRSHRQSTLSPLLPGRFYAHGAMHTGGVDGLFIVVHPHFLPVPAPLRKQVLGKCITGSVSAQDRVGGVAFAVVPGHRVGVLVRGAREQGLVERGRRPQRIHHHPSRSAIGIGLIGVVQATVRIRGMVPIRCQPLSLCFQPLSPCERHRIDRSSDSV